jgi:uncharacterized membrane protein
MRREYALLLKAVVWEILSAVLGFTVTYLMIGELGKSVGITLILLVLKSVLLACYDATASKILEKIIK